MRIDGRVSLFLVLGRLVRREDLRSREPFGALERCQRLVEIDTLQVGISPREPGHGAGVITLRGDGRWNDHEESEKTETRRNTQANILCRCRGRCP